MWQTSEGPTFDVSQVKIWENLQEALENQQEAKQTVAVAAESSGSITLPC